MSHLGEESALGEAGLLPPPASSPAATIFAGSSTTAPSTTICTGLETSPSSRMGDDLVGSHLSSGSTGLASGREGSLARSAELIPFLVAEADASEAVVFEGLGASILASFVLFSAGALRGRRED